MANKVAGLPLYGVFLGINIPILLFTAKVPLYGVFLGINIPILLFTAK